MFKLFLSLEYLFKRNTIYQRAFFFFFFNEPLISYAGTKKSKPFLFRSYQLKRSKSNGCDIFVNKSWVGWNYSETAEVIYIGVHFNPCSKLLFDKRSQKRNYFKNQRFRFYNSTCNETHVLAKRSRSIS